MALLKRILSAGEGKKLKDLERVVAAVGALEPAIHPLSDEALRAKTLVSTMPVYLNSLQGRGVHVVTVNDYLAKRDAEWMGGVHRFLGLTVGPIQAHMQPEERRPPYRLALTSGTNNAF